MVSIRTSLAFAFLERFLLLGLQIASFALIARLLTPQQVGLYSVALAVIGIAQVVRDFGIANFLVQRKELDATHIGSAFGLTLILGVGLFAIVTFAAPFVGRFYNDDGMSGIVRLIACNFLILAFNSIALALLRREMNFKTLMRLNVCAALIGTSTTLSLAWAGMGAWSLAWGEIASNLSIAIGACVVRRGHVFPRPCLTHWRTILEFGGKLTASNIVTSISMDINDLALGKIMGFAPVAIVSRAQGLMNLFHRDFMGTVRGVAFPAFSKAHRDGDSVEARFVSSLGMVTAIAWPFYGFVAMFPLDILHIVFGPQWDSAAPLVPYFCLTGALVVNASLIPTAMIAVGRPNLAAMADLVVQPIKAIVLILVIYHFRALEPFAIGFLAVSAAAVPFFYAVKQRCLPTDFKEIGRILVSNLWLTLVTLLPAFVILRAASDSKLQWTYLHFFACVAATGVAWLLALWRLDHALYREGVSIFRAKFGHKRQS